MALRRRRPQTLPAGLGTPNQRSPVGDAPAVLSARFANGENSVGPPNRPPAPNGSNAGAQAIPPSPAHHANRPPVHTGPQTLPAGLGLPNQRTPVDDTPAVFSARFAKGESSVGPPEPTSSPNNKRTPTRQPSHRHPPNRPPAPNGSNAGAHAIAPSPA